MKLHKITNVDLSICNVEQKFAYNYFSCYAEIMNANEIIAIVKRDELSPRKVNTEAVIHYIKLGYDNYKALKYNILTTWQSVGNLFR